MRDAKTNLFSADRAGTLTATAGQDALQLPKGAFELLRCPKCESSLRISRDKLTCENSDCAVQYPIVEGVGILSADDTSWRSYRNDYSNRPTTWRRLRRLIAASIPVQTLNAGGRRAIKQFIALIEEQTASPAILNIGEIHFGALTGPVLPALRDMQDAIVLHADCALGPGTNLVVDWCALPMADETFDAVVIDTGLEHVLEPSNVVSEVHRVLKEDGLVYVDMPFMTPVHGGATDFSRLTPVGLRALFRDFERIEHGVTTGPAVALSEMIAFFIVSFARRQWARLILKAFCRLSLFWVKYLDLIPVSRPGALDAAGGTFFIGRKSGRTADDAEIVRSYRGIVPSMYEPLSRTRTG